MKQYNPPKRVTIIRELQGKVMVKSVDLVKYDDNGVVFYDKEEFGENKIFIPYSAFITIVEGDHEYSSKT